MLRFRDIKPFTRESSYEVDVQLNYLEEHIRTYIDDYGLELNPDFQRGHVWTEAQQVAFVEFLLRGGKSGYDVYFNHDHWRMPRGKGKGDSFVCVDGLQRITACRKFVNNKIKAFGHYRREYTDSPGLIRLRFHVNDLKTRAEVLTWYLEFNAGGTIHTEAELDRVRNLLEKELTSRGSKV